MNTPNDGGPAFPGGVVYDPRRESMEHMGAFMDLGGMSLRAYFSGRALQGMLSCYEVQKNICNNDPRYKQQADGMFNFATVVALNALEFADALIAELNKQPDAPASQPPTP